MLGRYGLAQLTPAQVAGIVVEDVPGRAEEALSLTIGARFPAALQDARRLLAGGAGGVSSHRLEADADVVGIALPAPVGHFGPIAADPGEDVRRDEQIAVQLVGADDEVAVTGVEEVVFLQVLLALAV
jgi:hypothetical protein